MFLNPFKIKTREEFDTLMYRSIAFLYTASVVVIFSAALSFLYKTINAPFSLDAEDIAANSPRVNRDELKRVLQKLGIRETVMERSR